MFRDNKGRKRRRKRIRRLDIIEFLSQNFGNHHSIFKFTDLCKNKTVGVKINTIREGKGNKINTHQNYIFFPRLKLLMLSSKISHTAAFVLQQILPLSSVGCGRFDDVDDVDAAVDRD